MFDVAKQLSVQSWCFRHFKTIDELIAQIKGIGLSQVELCGVQIDFNDEAAFEPAIQKFKDAGIQISGIGVQYFGNDRVNEEKWFKFCKMAGTKLMSVAFGVDNATESYKFAEKMAEKYDVLLGIHNHGGYDWLGNSTILDYVFRNTGPRMGLCLDSAWCMHASEDPLKWAEKFSDRLYGVHVKDFIYDRAGMWTDVVVGTGNLKLPEFMKLALKAPKIKTVVLEYELDEENPGPALRACAEEVRKATA